MSFFKKVKDGLKDPKKKSLTLLGIYFVFFVFVFIVLNGSNSNTSVVTEKDEPTTINNYEDMKSYQYKFSYTSGDIVDIIEGTYCADKSLFTFNGGKYYLENDLLYFIDNDSYYLSNIEYNVSKLFSDNLYIILKDSKEESKTTYNDGTIEINYSIDSNLFYSYYFDTQSNYQNVVNLKVIEGTNNTISIAIDLSNLNISLNKIGVEYSNINNIKDLEFNKDNYIYRE